MVILKNSRIEKCSEFRIALGILSRQRLLIDKADYGKDMDEIVHICRATIYDDEIPFLVYINGVQTRDYHIDSCEHIRTKEKPNFQIVFGLLFVSPVTFRTGRF